MEKIKRLYPLVFHPIVMEEPWGKENIAIADLGIEDSVVAEGWLSDNSIGEIMETYLERVVGDEVYSYYGRQFPVLVKELDIDGEMPVYVHPDDEIAGQRYDSLGGKELWYIVGAEPDAMIYLGFNQDVTAAELYERCGNGTVRDVMNHVRPSAGDFFMVEPGIPHSASGKMKIAVIKESSELPFRRFMGSVDTVIRMKLGSSHKVLSSFSQETAIIVMPVSMVAKCVFMVVCLEFNGCFQSAGSSHGPFYRKSWLQ